MNRHVMTAWDHIVALGWGPVFAAGNVLTCLRTPQDPVQSLAMARWYYAKLKQMKALNKVVALRKLLTKEELAQLDGEKEHKP